MLRDISVFLLIFFIKLACISGQEVNEIHCMDEWNKPVDWFVVYKYPLIKIPSRGDPLTKGLGYAYITSESIKESPTWKESTKSINESQSLVGFTLSPLYSSESSSTLAHVLYNDEKPDGKTTEYLGHTKGVVVSGNATGFWLIHSVPHFPPLAKTAYSYPKSGTHYGQSFLCITLNASQINIVGKQLKYNEPNVYDKSFPGNLKTFFPNLASAADGEKISSAPWYHLTNITTLDGLIFTSYAKSKNFGKDLYADWVAPNFQTDLLVQSWLNGPGKMKSACSQLYKVKNVEKMSLDPGKFSTHEDHSKWAVADKSDKPWACVGDINRMEHQKQRGGGTVCLQNIKLWEFFRKAVDDFDKC